MLKAVLDGVMDRRSTQLLAQVGSWIPSTGPVLDLGSGTGHLAAAVEGAHNVEVITADVSNIHLVGPPPVVISDGALPFEPDRFTAALLVFMLAYPRDPVSVLREAARVTRGPVIVVQTLSAGTLGRPWHRLRECCWTFAAFHLSKLVGYVPRDARFTMHTRRFYDAHALQRDVMAAGLRVRAQRERVVLPGRALMVAAWLLEKHG